MLIDGKEWKVVPVEPTPEMRVAGKNTIKGADTMFEGILAELAYRSMLAAAPTPPAQTEPSDALTDAGQVQTLLGRSLADIQGYIDEIGGCDHSADICCCDLIRLAYDIRAAMQRTSGQEAIMTDRYESRATTHADDCWSWGPGHYKCAVGKIERLRAENERLRAEMERLRGLVVSRFDQDGPPTFRQGTPEHELEDPVTAEHCAWFVAEIKRLRAEVERLQEALVAQYQEDHND